MVDITKDEFWENRYDEVSKKEKKKNKIKDFIVKHKFFTSLLVSLGVLMTVNTILIYKFLRILNKL